MKYWNEYNGHKKLSYGKKVKYDNNIYSFDIETTSYIIHNNKMYQAQKYQELSKKEQEKCIYGSNMYIWQFSINEEVYYGRTWEEFKSFLKLLEENIPEKKLCFVHNFSFEFQFLKSEFNFKEVIARKSHKVMKAILSEFNIEFRCSYMMSNCALGYLPKLYKLPVEKLKGELDYKPLRNTKTTLTEQELKYCENDCLVVYYYIKYELETYERVNNIPLTSTGHVRRELKELTRTDYVYKKKVGKAVNVDPSIYSLLTMAFGGGYTHSNYIHTDEVIEDVDSWDFTSSYPYVLTTHVFPMSKFMKCKVYSVNDLNKLYAYLLVVSFKNLKSKYYNHFLSMSKCHGIKGGKYDNGRIMSAESIEYTVLTDVDFKLILATYDCEYEILESYSALYGYLPKKLINFILDKYVLKTQYKGVKEKEVEYSKQKSLFNSIYGMSVTATITDSVEYDNVTGWSETPISSEEIIKKLKEEEKAGFMSFSWGVWCTSWARTNLIQNIIAKSSDGRCIDDYMIYADTDSLKLMKGYPKETIETYNKYVENKIKHVSEVLNIPLEKFAPKDIKGKTRMLGLFDDDGHYEEFKTLGAKKYCVTKIVKEKDINNHCNVLERYIDGTAKVLEITVSGVPKTGCHSLNSVYDFKDDLVFKNEITNKNLLIYCDSQAPIEMEDYQGNKEIIKDGSGCCIIPTTYVLGKTLEYAELLEENHAKRSLYTEMLDFIK